MTIEQTFSTSSSLDPAEFDEYESSYDSALARGLRLTGEAKEYYARRRLEWLRRYLDGEGIQPRTVLDFGCGTGAGTRLARAILGAEHVIGVDVSSGLLASAARTACDGISFRHTRDVAASQQFDVAVCNGVFHHIEPRDRSGAVSYVHARLRPGGIFALWENNPWNPGTRLVMKRIPFDRNAKPVSPVEGRALLMREGFHIRRVAYLFYFPRAFAVLRPLERFLTRVPLGGQYCVVGSRGAG